MAILKVRNPNGSWSDIPAIKGEPGASVTIKNVSESTADGGNNVVTFSDNKTVTIKNGTKGDKGDTGADASVYATCDTAAATAAKVVTVVGDDSWELKVGKVVMVYFASSNSASNVTLNVNNTGAYPIWYNNAEYTSTGTAYTGYAKRVIEYMFNGTHWVWMGSSYDSNTTYKNVTLGHGYATCSTAEATAAKVGTLSSYTLTLGGTVAVKFTYAVPANATLNINSKGAKNMFYRGAKITAGVIKAGDIATFIYDGTQYQLLSIDRWQNDIVANATAIADLSSAKDSLVTEVETLKTSVSEGKSLIASAVTDKGVSTADDATFATMATNIRAIESGGAEDGIISKSISGNYVNSRVTTIAQYAFASCSNLTSVSFPIATTIKDHAFAYCSNLTSVNFPAATTIEDNAFAHCSNLTSVNFPADTTIGSYAFSRCSALTSVSFPAATTICSGAFGICTALTSVNFPAATTIEDKAFEHCSNLTSVNFPAATTIGSYAFSRCSALTSVSFPAATTIGFDAFAYCYMLSKFYLAGSSVCRLATTQTFFNTPYDGTSHMFSGTPYIYVPRSLLSDYKCAENWTYFGKYMMAIEDEGLEEQFVDFMIYDKSYRADTGMTWGDWVESEYNTDDYYIIDSLYICEAGTNDTVITNSSGYVTINDVIIADEVYWGDPY